MRDWWAGRRAIAGEAVVTGVLAAAFAGALAVTAVAIATSWDGTYWPFGFVAGTVVCAIALVRRRHLLWAAAAGFAVGAITILAAWYAHLPREPGPAMALALSVLVGSALRTLPARSAVAVAGGGLAVVVGATLAALPMSSGVIPTMNAVTWLTGVALGLGLRRLDARRVAVAAKVRRSERLVLARELHDVVAHHVTGIVVAAQAARLVARKYPERVDGSLADIEGAGSDALAAMRRVVGLLRDTEDAAPAGSGTEQLSALVDRFAGQGPAVRLELPAGEPTWPPEVTSTVYRVVQESLTNISRHAGQAHAVRVRVAQDRESVTVEVTDDAPAPGPSRYPRRGGYGLVGMRERVEALGGTLVTGREPGPGWSVRATLPLPARGGAR
ncbi:sensor histidine kinase [Actinopolymorpha alba]|uniref:sensor histidine kinase n=1 Tax=Actinopolymorpha alba TaxID=533267 RepID=UPI0012F6A31D|nr:sensor histidine kinase [Actinopolymorpha alba]